MEDVEDPPNSLKEEEVNISDLGRRSPWWGRRQEGTSDHHQCWSQFLVGFIHPVRWHPPDDGRHCALGLSEIGAEGQKVQKSKLVTFFLL